MPSFLLTVGFFSRCSCTDVAFITLSASATGSANRGSLTQPAQLLPDPHYQAVSIAVASGYGYNAARSASAGQNLRLLLGRLLQAVYLREKSMLTFNAEVRKEQGKGASRRLRAANKFPAIIYGGNAEPVAIELDHDAVINVQKDDSFYSDVLTINVAGKEEKVKVQAVQRHPFKPKVTHIDFVRA